MTINIGFLNLCTFVLQIMQNVHANFEKFQIYQEHIYYQVNGEALQQLVWTELKE